METPLQAEMRIKAAHERAQKQKNERIQMAVTGKAGEILGHLEEDEPIFVFRAKDILSTFALDEYAKLVEKFNPHSPQLNSLVEATIQFREWQRDHPSLVKLPD